MDPVTTAAVVTAVISAAGTVLAAWVQGRAQRPAGHREPPPGRDGSAAGVGATGERELPPDDQR